LKKQNKNLAIPSFLKKRLLALPKFPHSSVGNNMILEVQIPFSIYQNLGKIRFLFDINQLH